MISSFCSFFSWIFTTAKAPVVLPNFTRVVVLSLALFDSIAICFSLSFAFFFFFFLFFFFFFFNYRSICVRFSRKLGAEKRKKETLTNSDFWVSIFEMEARVSLYFFFLFCFSCTFSAAKLPGAFPQFHSYSCTEFGSFRFKFPLSSSFHSSYFPWILLFYFSTSQLLIPYYRANFNFFPLFFFPALSPQPNAPPAPFPFSFSFF